MDREVNREKRVGYWEAVDRVEKCRKAIKEFLSTLEKENREKEDDA